VSTYVAIIPGHGDRTRGGRDLYDPGAVCGELREAEVVRRLAPVIVRHAQALGVAIGIHDAPAGAPGRHPLRGYTARCAEGVRSAAARRCSRAIVAHLHLNSNRGEPGSYCAAIHDAGEPGTPAMAAAVEAELRRLAGLGKPANGSTWQALGSTGSHNLIQAAWAGGRPFAPGVTTHAIVLEAAFINQPLHHGLFDGTGLEALGAAIARGLALAAGRTS
jgi:hypothetical protein